MGDSDPVVLSLSVDRLRFDLACRTVAPSCSFNIYNESRFPVVYRVRVQCNEDDRLYVRKHTGVLGPDTGTATVEAFLNAKIPIIALGVQPSFKVRVFYLIDSHRLYEPGMRGAELWAMLEARGETKRRILKPLPIFIYDSSSAPQSSSLPEAKLLLEPPALRQPENVVPSSPIVEDPISAVIAPTPVRSLPESDIGSHEKEPELKDHGERGKPVESLCCEDEDRPMGTVPEPDSVADELSPPPRPVKATTSDLERASQSFVASTGAISDVSVDMDADDVIDALVDVAGLHEIVQVLETRVNSLEDFVSSRFDELLSKFDQLDQPSVRKSRFLVVVVSTLLIVFISLIFPYFRSHLNI